MSACDWLLRAASVTTVDFAWTYCFRLWRRTVEAEMIKMNHGWGTIQRLANDRQGVEELCCFPIRQLE